MHVGKRIKALMQAKGISSEEMAFHCGVTPGAVSNWFSSGHITRDNLVIVCDVLQESLRYVCTGDERDRPLGEIEYEFSRRDVSEGTRQAILTLLCSQPMRPPPPYAESDASEADAQHFRNATRPLDAPAWRRTRRRRE